MKISKYGHGIYKNLERDTYYARIQTNNKSNYIGYFLTLEDAKLAVEKWKIDNNYNGNGKCLQCNKDFIKIQHSHKYCSTRCSDKYKYDNNLNGKRDYVNKSSIDRHFKYKVEFVKMYGGKCECCGETAIEFLTLEHKNRDGNIERLTKSPIKIRKDATENYQPDKYGILCWNCNCSQKDGKTCPHKLKNLNNYEPIEG